MNINKNKIDENEQIQFQNYSTINSTIKQILFTCSLMLITIGNKLGNGKSSLVFTSL